MDKVNVASSPDDTRQRDKKSSFVGNVTKLVSGTVISQIVVIASYPLITRIYGPEVYGYLAILLSIINIFTTIVCLRYNYALMMPKEEEDAYNIFATCLGIITVISALLIPIFFFFSSEIATIFNADGISEYLIFIPLIVFVEGLFILLKYHNTRKKRFGYQAIANTTQSISLVVLQTGMGLLRSPSAFSLILSEIFGRIIGVFVLLIHFIKYDCKKLIKSFNPKKSWSLLKRYKKFILIDTWSSLINSLSWQTPALLLSAFFSPVIAGFYALGFKAFQMPMHLIGSAIEQVFFQGAVEKKHAGTLNILLENVVTVFIMFICVPVLSLSVMGGDLFALVFGEAWREAGVYVQILSVWAFIWVIVSPLNTMIQILEIHTLGFLMLLLNLITRMVSMIIGGVFNDIYLALVLFTLSGIVVYGGLLIIYFRKSGASFLRVLKNCWFTAGYLICMQILLLLIINILNIQGPVIVLLGIMSIGIYYLLLLRLSETARQYIYMFIPKSKLGKKV